MFFASADVFIDAFDARDVPGTQVVIDVAQARFWDVTAVAALDKVLQRLRHHGLQVRLDGLDANSRRLLRRLDRDAGALEASLP